MAVTEPSAVTSSIPEKYAKRVLRDIEKDTFWAHLVTPEGGGGAFIRRDELLEKPGETVHIQVTRPLSGAGLTGDVATLEGSEESLSTEEITVAPVYVRHGVRVNRRAQKKSLVDLREKSDWAEDTFYYGLGCVVAYGHDYKARRGFEYASTQLRSAADKQS